MQQLIKDGCKVSVMGLPTQKIRENKYIYKCELHIGMHTCEVRIFRMLDHVFKPT